MTLTVYRGGQYIEVELTFDAQPQNTGSEEDNTQSSGNNGGNGGSGQMPGNWDNWQDFYNYFFGNRG